MTKTAIEWTDEVWNPVTGCTKVSAGCKHCYAETIANRFWGKDHLEEVYVPGIEDNDNIVERWVPRKFTEVRCHPERLEDPLHWRKPRRIFVNSMSDLFHPNIPDSFVDQIFEIMHLAYQHTFLILTKRASFMYGYLARRCKPGGLLPLPNVWLGVSCEDQQNANERISLLVQTPAAVRFISCEPLLGPLDLRDWTEPCSYYCDHGDMYPEGHRPERSKIDWIIVGGESGSNHRPMEIKWLENIVEQCRSSNTPVFVKQDSAYHPGQQGRIPDSLWIKEIPK